MRQVYGHALRCLLKGSILIDRASLYQSLAFRFPAVKNIHNRPNASIIAPQLAYSIRKFSVSTKAKRAVTSGLDSAQHRKPARQSAGKLSLRAVAAEAQRSRKNFIKGKGKNRFIDPEADTKKVTAFCAAEQYDISIVARLLQKEGFEIDPCQTGLSSQVIHVQTSHWLPEASRDSVEHGTGLIGDVMVFPSGTVVTWNVPDRQAIRLVKQVLPVAATGSHPDLLETEDLGYLEDPSTDSSSIIGDTIILGTKVEDQTMEASELEAYGQHHDEGDARERSFLRSSDGSSQHPGADAVLAKIAFSSGLARSTKLAVLETLFSDYFDSTRSIPAQLSQGTKLSFTRDFILRKTGELLNIRAQLNLYSELTDSLPDLFWDSRHELGLEGYYDATGRVLDVGVRIKVLNEKMNYAQEIATVLRERLSEKHGTQLEWYIIILIAIEICFEIYHFWKDYNERSNSESTEALLRQYLLASESGKEKSGA